MVSDGCVFFWHHCVRRSSVARKFDTNLNEKSITIPIYRFDTIQICAPTLLVKEKINFDLFVLKV